MDDILAILLNSVW